MNIKNNIPKFSRVTSKQANFSLILKLILKILRYFMSMLTYKGWIRPIEKIEFCSLQKVSGKSLLTNIRLL